VDWDAVRDRVDELRRGLRAEERFTPARAREVLAERARELANVVTRERAEAAFDAVTFTLAGETYAIDARFVVEVFRLADLTLVPGAEAPMIGLTAWRGRLLTILDLRAMIGMSTSALNDLSHVIVLGEERAAFGILADTVEELVTITESVIHAPRAGVASEHKLLRGIANAEMLVLDAKGLLRADEDST